MYALLFRGLCTVRVSGVRVGLAVVKINKTTKTTGLQVTAFYGYNLQVPAVYEEQLVPG